MEVLTLPSSTLALSPWMFVSLAVETSSFFNLSISFLLDFTTGIVGDQAVPPGPRPETIPQADLHFLLLTVGNNVARFLLPCSLPSDIFLQEARNQ